jgi:hypothetical protein
MERKGREFQGEGWAKGNAMNIKRKFDLDVPDGFQIYELYIEPAGAYWKNSGTLKFIGSGKHLSLELEREPKNRHDPNAIKIIGVAKGWILKSRYHVGYVPADMAKRLVLGKFWPKVAATLRMVESREYTHIKFDLLGPEGRKKEYAAFKT